MIKKCDVLIVVSLCVICVVLFALTFISSDNKTAVIYLDGEQKYQIELSEVESEYTIVVGGCTLQINNEGVEFITSDCPDKLCVRRGILSRVGDTMACIPNKVVVSLKGSGRNQFDAVAY